MSDISSEERVIFYPTYGWRDDSNGTDRGEKGQADWLLDIHGIVFEPKFTSHKRDLLARFARRLLPRNDNTIEQTMFRRRFWSFLVDNIGGRTIPIRLGDQTYEIGPSTPDGHFRGTIRLSAGQVTAVACSQRTVNYEAVLPESTSPADDDHVRRFSGQVSLIEPTGLSLISDIDDTIKVSEVADTSRLVANVLARRYTAVPGMAKLYRDWAAQGIAFHLVSASPWQLYRPLARFCRQAEFPPATFHLKKWRIKEPSTLELFQSSAQLKFDGIREILQAFPGRRFILVGDSTQKDPEAFGQLLRQDEQQIVLALIRNVPGAHMTASRLSQAFAGVEASRFQLFHDAAELHELSIDCLASPR